MNTLTRFVLDAMRVIEHKVSHTYTTSGTQNRYINMAIACAFTKYHSSSAMLAAMVTEIKSVKSEIVLSISGEMHIGEYTIIYNYNYNDSTAHLLLFTQTKISPITIKGLYYLVNFLSSRDLTLLLREYSGGLEIGF